MFKAVRMVLFLVAFVLLAGVAVMLLWNALVPTIFDGPHITWIQALGLLILARILTGGRGHGGFGASRRARWRERWESKLAGMSPDERKRWQAEFGRSCSGRTSAAGVEHTGESDPIEAKMEG
jgi:hypothetical protein